MNLELKERSPSSRGPARASGSRSCARSSPKGRRWSRARGRPNPSRGSLASSPVAVDLASREGPANLVQRALDEHGRVDVLVNNVGGVRLRLGGFLGTSDEEFEWAMQINFFAALRATRAAVTAMLKQGGGAIVNIASVNAFFQPDGGTIDYGAAKAALVNLTKALSQEFGPRGIRINDVSPGPVSTDLWLGKDGVAQTVAKASGVDAETAKKNVIASIGGLATGRFTTPEEVATLVVMLASNRTGERHGIELRDRRRADQDAIAGAATRRDARGPPRRDAKRPAR